jgi:acyl-CoA thioesterase
MQEDPQQLAKACADAMYANDHCSRALGITIVETNPGNACLQMTVRDDMINGHGICHGGLIFTLADSCFAFACNSRNQSTVAQSCNIDFLRPGRLGDLLTATATETHLAGKNGIYDIVVRDQDENVIAQFRGKSRAIRGTLVDAVIK